MLRGMKVDCKLADLSLWRWAEVSLYCFCWKGLRYFVVRVDSRMAFCSLSVANI